MKLYSIWELVSLFTCVSFWISCDSVSMKDFVMSTPQIISFSPENGSIGSEIVVTGKYLDDVVSATIGGEKVTILQKVSNERLSLKVTDHAKSGKIILSNSIGEGASEHNFTIEYPAPVITSTSMPSKVEMSNKLLISGSHMNTVCGVFFTAEGHTIGNEANILSQNEDEILVKVPYVESGKAAITLKYFDGVSYVETPIESAPKLIIERYEPHITTSSFKPATIGDVVTLNGTFLTKIDKVTLGTIECNIVLQTENELKFTVPSSEHYADGDNTMALKISYFDGHEVHTLTNIFTVKVSFVLFWENKKIYAQGRDVEELSSFFSPETGLVYSNADWRTTVDPISYQYKATTCSENNKPAVSESEYNSIKPYFFFSGMNAGTLQINSPAGSNGQLKNFYIINNSATENRVPGINGSCYGTPVLTFLYLDPTKSSHKELIDEVKNGTLTHIDETTFPIDVKAKTCRGFSISSMKTSINTDVWAHNIFKVGTERKVNVDAVLLILYYNVNGSTANIADNVKRVGLLHIKTIDFKMYNNTNAPSSSSIEFDMYWQKKDYDYSKVQ